jgi:hypothetical protein
MSQGQRFVCRSLPGIFRLSFLFPSDDIQESYSSQKLSFPSLYRIVFSNTLYGMRAGHSAFARFHVAIPLEKSLSHGMKLLVTARQPVSLPK